MEKGIGSPQDEETKEAKPVGVVLMLPKPETEV